MNCKRDEAAKSLRFGYGRHFQDTFPAGAETREFSYRLKQAIFFFTRQPKNRFYPKMSGYASKETLYGMIKYPKQIVSPSWPLNSLWAGNQGNTPPTA